MPIIPLNSVKRRSEEDFHQLDYRVMGIAFGIQNDLGRLCEEAVYKNELTHRLIECGIEVVREYPVLLKHDSFEKTFFVDLFVDRGIVYEAKVASALTDSHRSQTLNYLFLTDTQHGKLVNFRPVEVEHEFVSTKLNSELRRQIQISDACWMSVCSGSELLKELMIALVKDWGAFLTVDAYREAAVHFLGGASEVCRDADLTFGGRLIGRQSVNHISSTTIFVFSAARTEGYPAMRAQLQKMLSLLPFAYLQWINLYHQQLQLVTLSRC